MGFEAEPEADCTPTHTHTQQSADSSDCFSSTARELQRGDGGAVKRRINELNEGTEEEKLSGLSVEFKYVKLHLSHSRCL